MRGYYFYVNTISKHLQTHVWFGLFTNLDNTKTGLVRLTILDHFVNLQPRYVVCNDYSCGYYDYKCNILT